MSIERIMDYHVKSRLEAIAATRRWKLSFVTVAIELAAVASAGFTLFLVLKLV